MEQKNGFCKVYGDFKQTMKNQKVVGVFINSETNTAILDVKNPLGFVEGQKRWPQGWMKMILLNICKIHQASQGLAERQNQQSILGQRR